MLTLPELQALMNLLNAGLRKRGLQAFQNGGGITLQSALGKLQAMADAATAEAEAQAREALKAELAEELKQAAGA